MDGTTQSPSDGALELGLARLDTADVRSVHNEERPFRVAAASDTRCPVAIMGQPRPRAARSTRRSVANRLCHLCAPARFRLEILT